MSLASSGIPGGQPSTTQPIAGPWLSPQVVMRKRWPKVLWDMRLAVVACVSGRASPRLRRRDWLCNGPVAAKFHPILLGAPLGRRKQNDGANRVTRRRDCRLIGHQSRVRRRFREQVLRTGGDDCSRHLASTTRPGTLFLPERSLRCSRDRTLRRRGAFRLDIPVRAAFLRSVKAFAFASGFPGGLTKPLPHGFEHPASRGFTIIHHYSVRKSRGPLLRLFFIAFSSVLSGKLAQCGFDRCNRVRVRLGARAIAPRLSSLGFETCDPGFSSGLWPLPFWFSRVAPRVAWSEPAAEKSSSEKSSAPQRRVPPRRQTGWSRSRVRRAPRRSNRSWSR